MLKKMRYVHTVYEEKSFSKAAERLFVAQRHGEKGGK